MAKKKAAAAAVHRRSGHFSHCVGFGRGGAAGAAAAAAVRGGAGDTLLGLAMTAAAAAPIVYSLLAGFPPRTPTTRWKKTSDESPNIPATSAPSFRIKGISNASPAARGLLCLPAFPANILRALSPPTSQTPGKRKALVARPLSFFLRYVCPSHAIPVYLRSWRRERAT